MTARTHTASRRGHTTALGAESERRWKAPGGVECVAIRESTPDGAVWRLDAGPGNLVGRTWRNIRDLRIAVKQAPRGVGVIRDQLVPLIEDVGVSEVARRAGTNPARISDYVTGRRPRLREDLLERVIAAVGRHAVLAPLTDH